MTWFPEHGDDTEAALAADGQQEAQVQSTGEEGGTMRTASIQGSWLNEEHNTAKGGYCQGKMEMETFTPLCHLTTARQ